MKALMMLEHYIGRFYLDEWKNPIENEFEFVCRDAIGVLDTISFDGMFWENSVSLGEGLAQSLTRGHSLLSIRRGCGADGKGIFTRE